MKAVLYLRQSLDRSGEGAAIGRQEAECRELAERHGWEIVKVYTDNDRSATHGKRPGWTQLLSDLRAGMYDVLACWHTDRLYRRLRDLVEIVEIAESRALRIASVKAADVDLSTPAGRMIAGMLGAAARYEVEQKGARQVAANRARAQAGVSRWTTRPYGYDMEADTVVVVESEAAELRQAAGRLLAGDTSAAVVRDMNRRGLTTAAGKPWTAGTLHRLLANPRHAGRVAYRGEDYGTGSWPAVFDPETFDQLAAVLSDPRRHAYAASTVAKHLLSGLAVCGRCGDLMYANAAPDTIGKDLKVYRCLRLHLARRLDRVDDVVEEHVIARLTQPDAADLIYPDLDLDRLRGEIVELRGRRDTIVEMLADGLADPGKAREQTTRLTGRISVLERDIMTAAGSAPLAQLVTGDDVRAVWVGLEMAAKREVIRLLFTVRILPAGRGTRFDPTQIEVKRVASADG